MQKKINIENYQAYLLDLAEGNLSYADEKALIQFLARHPELEVDLEDLPVLEVEAIALDGSFKAGLLKHQASGLSEKDHLMISAIEGQLSIEEQKSLSELLQDEHVQKELAYYQKTKLAAETIAYPDKNQLLKKETRVVPLWAMISSIAAAILLMIYLGLPQENTYAPRGYTYKPMEYQDEEINVAFVLEEQSGNRGRDELPHTKDESIQASADYLAEKTKQQKEEGTKEVKEDPDSNQPAEVAPLDRQAFAKIENTVPEMSPAENEEIADSENLTQTDESEPNQGKVLSPLEYAREVIKKDVLKNRTLAESVKEEVENLTNKKVNFERAENESEAQFALNIGKLKIRKK